MQVSHCGFLPLGEEETLKAIASLRASGVFPSGFGSPSLLGQQDRATSPSGASGVETTSV
ncbi:MAG: hypothetical protein V7L22_13770 [Nostoc sp.]|uniref:hypothetical protein n=1 Tax=Nostoc sp. TaxID=1180 RepID=UPI002FFBBDB4